MTGTRRCRTESRKRSTVRGSYTGWVMTYSAPARTFSSSRRISLSQSGLLGSAPHPMWMPSAGPMRFPARSQPWLRWSMIRMRPMESTS